jgi:beta-1,4-mannosyl-glycoprotein beta-1,4-N-acetylglucosaminyltransferase
MLKSAFYLKIGYLGHYSGHHCSWCFNAEGIQTKLLSAQKADKPRWGDYPDKLKIDYIDGLIKRGN